MFISKLILFIMKCVVIVLSFFVIHFADFAESRFKPAPIHARNRMPPGRVIQVRKDIGGKNLTGPRILVARYLRL